MKIACLGPKGSFTSIVANSVFPNDEHIYLSTHEGCLNLKREEVDYALYPLENNLGGFVYDTLNSIYYTSKISIKDIHTLKIEQNLIGHSKIEDVREIHSHPQAIAQCQKSISKLEKRVGRKIKIVKVGSTSEAIVEASKNHNIVAIGSKEGSALYGVPILKESFQDKARNETRFAIFQLGSPSKRGKKYKSMFLIEVKNLTDGFMEIVGLVKSLSIDILSISHHPIYKSSGAWEYAFFIELEGHILNNPLKIVHKILLNKRLKNQTRKGRWLGSYEQMEIKKI